MVMSPDPDAPFATFKMLARLGLGGPIAGGRQYVSWIHHRDFVRAVAFLIARTDVPGPVNVAAPSPLTHADFMAAIRTAVRMPVGLPATAWMAEIGACALKTETELLFKSRRVVPERLLAEGFQFEFPEWPAAARDLVAAMRAAA